MRKALKKLLNILDGTPPADGERQRGQSMVELALVTPILLIMLAGLVEVGWFANNFLILLEASRVGARNATVLDGRQAPLSWDEDFSVVVDTNLHPALLDRTNWPTYNMATTNATLFADYRRRYLCDAEADVFRFYNLVSCIVQTSMDPLEIQDGLALGEEVDDVVISAFSVQIIEDNGGSGPGDMDLPGRPAGHHAVVVARYPTRANECNVQADGVTPQQDSGRDPFDFDQNNVHTVNDPDDPFDENYSEFDGMDDIDVWLNPSGGNVPERQRGFVWRGQHIISDSPGCIGSEFSIADIEELMRLPDFSFTAGAQGEEERDYLPNQGIVLVEVFWKHRLLTEFGFFNPMLNVLGEESQIQVWAVFPLPSLKPTIDFE